MILVVQNESWVRILEKKTPPRGRTHLEELEPSVESGLHRREGSLDCNCSGEEQRRAVRLAELRCAENMQDRPAKGVRSANFS